MIKTWGARGQIPIGDLRIQGTEIGSLIKCQEDILIVEVACIQVKLTTTF